MTVWITVLLAWGIITLPGTLVGYISGMRLRWSIVAAMPISIGIWGLLGWLYGVFSIPVTALSLGIGMVVIAILGVMIRLLYTTAQMRIGKRRNKHTHSTHGSFFATFKEQCVDELHTHVLRGKEGIRFCRHPREIIPFLSRAIPLSQVIAFLGVLAGSILIISRGIRTLTDTPWGLENIYQSWDVLWHASTIRYIMDSGIASPTMMGAIQNYETQDTLFYPTGWHTAVFVIQDMLNISPVAALNVGSYIIAGVGIPLSAALLTWVIMGRTGWKAGMSAGFAALISSGVLSLFYISYYVGMWPYLAGIALVGIITSVIIAAASDSRMIFGAIFALLGAGVVHPSVATVVVLMVLVWWLCHGLWFPLTHRFREFLHLATIAVVTVILLVPPYLSGVSQAEEVKSFSDELSLDYFDIWRKVLQLQTRHAIDYGVDWVLLWLAGIGIVVYLLWQRRFWPVVSFAIFTLIAVNSVRNFSGILGDILNAYASLHYNTTHRLILPVALFMSIFAAIAVAFILLTLIFGVQKLISPPPLVLAALLTISSLGAGYALASHAQKQYGPAMNWALTAPREATRIIDSDELKAYEWLSKQPHAYDGVIANVSTEGTGWIYPLYGMNALHKHFYFPPVSKDSATTMLYWYPIYAGAGLRPENPGDLPRYKNANLTDFALRDLNVKYVISSPPNFFYFQRDIFEQTGGLWLAPGLTPVYRGGDTVIFAVNAAFTDEELASIVDNNYSPVPLPPYRTREHLDYPMESQDPDYVDKYKHERIFPRPEIWDKEIALEDSRKDEQNSTSENQDSTQGE